MLQHENLKGRVAVVTGGGGVLCSSFAKDLSASGVKVAVLDIRKEAAQAVADEINASGGAATTERAEICTVCGYEIAPKKPAASNDDDDDDDDDSSQASNTDRKATGAATPPAATATPATPGVVKPSVIPVPPTTPAADENRKEDAAKPSGEAQDTQESSGEAPQEERIDSMTAQTSDSQESGTEQITETSGKGTNAGRVAAAAAAGAVVVGGGGAAVYVTMIKGKFKFK